MTKYNIVYNKYIIMNYFFMSNVIDQSELNIRRIMKAATEKEKEAQDAAQEISMDISTIISPEQQQAYLLNQYRRIIGSYWSNLEESDINAIEYSNITFDHGMSQMDVYISSLDQTRTIPVSMLDFEDKRLLWIIRI